MIRDFFPVCLLAAIWLLPGCSQREDLAPVVESKWRAVGHANVHRVERGETLYAIAFRYDLDYQQLARMNHLASPYLLHVGQVLRVHAQYTVYQPQTVSAKSMPAVFVPRSSPPLPVSRNHDMVSLRTSASGWHMPCAGRIVESFAPELGHKGINIAGEPGEKIYAASSGVVAYAGNGLKGYGNLIIIKHGQQYMTAYGNNARNLVHEGQFVKAGQVIADMGMIDRRYYGVHFEIRNQGKPVNPRNYL